MWCRLRLTPTDFIDLENKLSRIDDEKFRLSQLKVQILDEYGISTQSLYQYRQRYSNYTEDSFSKRDLDYINKTRKDDKHQMK